MYLTSKPTAMPNEAEHCSTQIALGELEAVYGFIYSRVGNRTDAEDLTQEVALKALPRLRTDAAAPEIRGYLYATARSVLAAFWTGRFRLPESELSENLGLEIQHGFLPSTSTSAQLSSILAGLSPKHRRVLELRFLLGYSLREVADEMGKTIGSVKIMQLRALRTAAANSSPALRMRAHVGGVRLMRQLDPQSRKHREAHMRKTIVVTGTATGLGRATINKFAAEGWNVVATVRKESDLETHSDLPSVKTLLLDVDDETAAGPFAQLAQEQFGRVDVLVNNAGYYQMGPLEGTSMDQVHRQYQTNVFGLLALTKAFLPSFRAQGAGIVINIASITGDQGYPYNSVYASSKAAVAVLSESLSIELAEFGVVVRAILPGLHATRIFTKIDRGDSIPDAYRAGITQFFAGNSPTGSEPSVTAEVIYRAAVDPDPTTVRYYSGPDAVSIPRGKRILGAEGYWQEFRNAVMGCPSDLWDTLISKPGTTPVETEV